MIQISSRVGNMHPSHVLRWSACGVVAGTALITFFPAAWSMDVWLLASMSVGALFLFWSFRRRWMRLVCIACIGFFIGAARFLVALPSDLPRHIDSEGIVQRVMPERYGSVTLNVALADGRGVAITDLRGTFAYGDRLSTSCAPERVERDGLLDVRRAAQGIMMVCRGARVTVLAHGAGHSIMHALLEFRTVVERHILQRIAEPSASLLLGVLLGIDTHLSWAVERAFTRTGLVHLLVVSGMHMVLLAKLLDSLLALFGIYPRGRALVTILTLLAFLALIGFPASALRGFWFALLTIVAALLGRTRSMGTAILGVASAMILWNPFLVRDIGFLLSFFATVGISLGRQRVEAAWEVLKGWTTAWRGVPTLPTPRPRDTWWRRVIWGPLLQFLRKTLFETLGATLLTAPLVATVFGQFSLVAPVANLLIVGWIAPFMLLGLLVVVLSWIPLLSVVVTTLLVGLGAFMLAIVHTLAALPFASLVVTRSGIIMVGLYTIIALWIFRLPRVPIHSRSDG